jgi:hypothetical protein
VSAKAALKCSSATAKIAASIRAIVTPCYLYGAATIASRYLGRADAASVPAGLG